MGTVIRLTTSDGERGFIGIAVSEEPDEVKNAWGTARSDVMELTGAATGDTLYVNRAAVAYWSVQPEGGEPPPTLTAGPDSSAG